MVKLETEIATSEAEARASREPVPEPRALLARLQRPGARARRGRATRPLLERAKFLAIFARTSTSSSRSGCPGCRSRSTPGSGRRLARRDGPRASSCAAIRARVDELVEPRRRGSFAKEIAPALEDVGIALSRTGRSSTTTTARTSSTSSTSAGLPGAHAARGRPGAPVPVHLEPVAQPRGRRARPGDAATSASPGSRSRRSCPASSCCPTRAVRPARAGHRRAPRPRCSPGWRSSPTTRSGSTRDADFELERRGRGPARGDRERAARCASARPTSCGSRSTRTMPEEVLELLCRELELDGARRLRRRRAARPLGPLGARTRSTAPSSRTRRGRRRRRTRCSARTDPPPDLFRVLRAGDVLVHHPYDSFTTSVEAFVEQASRDPRCSRSSRRSTGPPGPESAIVRVARPRGRRRASRSWRSSSCKARFDEQANIELGARARRGGRARRVRRSSG